MARLASALNAAAKAVASTASVALLASLVNCSPDVPKLSRVDSLRIIGVQKNKFRGGARVGGSYALPGESVDFSMLWYNGLPDAATGHAVQRLWVGGCVNPLGDRFDQCVKILKARLPADPSLDPSLVQIVDDGSKTGSTISDTVTFQMPPREQAYADPADPTQTRLYGTYYVFFAACAGAIRVSSLDQDNVVPLTCLDDQGAPVGPDKFVVGYTTVYINDQIQNENPVLGGIIVWQGGKVAPVPLLPPAPACVGIDCFTPQQTAPKDLFCNYWPSACIPACPADGDQDNCPNIVLYPDVGRPDGNPPQLPPENDEDDVTYADPQAATFKKERLWINYLADRGKVRSDVRELRDGTGAWNTDLGSSYYAPKDPGWVHVWAVVRDDRGGEQWISVPLLVR